LTKSPNAMMHPLIIISGLPRSGTTWLGKLFDSHPRVLYRHEPDSVFPMKWLPTIIEDAGVDCAEGLREFVALIPKMRDAKVSASQPMFAKEFLGPLRHLLAEQALRLTKLSSASGWQIKVPPFCLPQAQADYVLAWKTIESSGRLGCFTHALQPLRVIHILRHPGGITASQLRGKRLNKFNGYDQAEDYNNFNLWLKCAVGARELQSLEQIKAMSEVERLTWLSLVRMEKAARDIASRPDCRIVIYEDLCARPMEILEELLRFCELDFSAQTQKFLHASTSKTDKRYFGVFKDSAESANKWKSELEDGALRTIQCMLAQSPLAKYWAGS